MKINLIVTAGGKSQRYGQKNKLFEPLDGSPVLIQAIRPFLQFDEITKIIIGIETSYADELLSALDMAGLKEDRRIIFSVGGSERTHTVKNALAAVDDDADYIMTHDGARPFVTPDLIQSVLAAVHDSDAALPLLPLTDAIVQLDFAQTEEKINAQITPVDRAKFRRVQTPFIAKADIFKNAYKNAQTSFYDDISVIKTLDYVKIAFVDGDEKNRKITYVSDLIHPHLSGCGYDIHRMQEGNRIRLCGVDIPCKFSFIAHSDGDVPVHAIMDAILSAVGEKDIGHFFPVDDPRYDGIDSMILLKEVLQIAHNKGYKPHNVTVSIIAESPKLSPYIDKMRHSLATAMSISPERVGISATTNESVGDLGKEKAIAAFASVSLTSI